MAISRRNFLKTAGIAAAGTIITASASPIIKNFPSVISKSGSKMKL
ncbi:MAG: twin-arginine translocation signal domain-containing protein, partial [Ignavibacteriaceae bacterium]|nr:twin-arginine translocation signal domain-containing protein [Ignavibacteriaceae bacterium]